MKNLQKVAGMIILLVLIFMAAALVRFRGGEEKPFLPEQLEYILDEDWRMMMLECAEGEPESHEAVQKRLKEALAEGKYREMDLPYEGKSGNYSLIAFQNDLPLKCGGLTMGITSSNAGVRVVLDGEVFYEYGFAGEEISGNRDHFVEIPNELAEGEVWIELTPAHPDALISVRDVKLETRDTIVIGVVGASVTDISCCLLIIIMAIIMFVLALIRRHTNQPSRGEVFLGLAGLCAGIYCFIGTDILSILYNIQRAYVVQEYLVLLTPLFLALYFDRNLHRTYPRRFTALLWCAYANAVAQILLQMLHMRRLEDMIGVSTAVVGLVCAAAAAGLLHFYYRNRQCETLLSVLALFVLLSGGIANVIVNIIYEDSNSNAAGQYSMAVFGVMMTVVHIMQLSKEYRVKAEENTRLLEEKVRITEQQNIQLALAKKDADEARHEALAANEAKGRFLAHMSHEIRTPINAVLGMDEMILRESKEQSIREYAMDIYTSGHTLLSLVNDILDFSRIESGKMEIVPVEYDISSLIHDLVNMASQRASDKNICLKVEADHEIPSRLYGDDVRIRQVLTNILTNAVKYTHEGTVWFRVQGVRKGNMAELRFEVEDTGIGIRQEDLPKLSAEFERIEEEKNRNIEGTGLGMSITIQLLALLGSRLQVESVYGKGSRFYFELEQEIIDDTPIGDFKERVRQSAENYSYDTRLCAPDARILVVDDNAVNRKVLRNLLKETRIQVTDAAGGRECLKLVRENHYDLIFLDHMMPEMDGIETLHHIKELSDFPCQDTPVVVLTANAVSGAKEKYLAEGFDDFLSKPVVPEKLEKMIRKMLPDELLTDPESVPYEGLAQTAADMAEDSFSEFPPVDGLDWQYAWMHLPDMELLQYTMNEFYAQIDSAADHLEQLYERMAEPEELTNYRIQVHAMKSLAATVGILPLSGVAKILEYAAGDGKIDVVTAMTAPFLEEWRSYREKLRGVFGMGTEVRKKVTDYSIIKALLEMIRFSMQEMDIDQADQFMGQLQEYEYPDEISLNIRKLSEAVTNLDPEEAERLADLLTEQIKEQRR